jgi:hypothetical protein
LGFYKSHNLSLEILNLLAEDYSETPGKKLELNKAYFDIASFETAISLNNKKNLVDAIAVLPSFKKTLAVL